MRGYKGLRQRRRAIAIFQDTETYMFLLTSDLSYQINVIHLCFDEALMFSLLMSLSSINCKPMQNCSVFPSSEIAIRFQIQD